MSAATVVRPTREHVEALAFAASAAAHARGCTTATIPLGEDLFTHPRYLSAQAADEAAQEALRTVLDLAFAELEQLRAEVGR